MTIENRDLQTGTKLAARFKKKDYTAEVVEAEQANLKGPTDNGMRIRLEDGREFRSVSSAAQAITGGSINGWRFWSLADTGGRAKAAKAQATEPSEQEQQPEPPGAGTETAASGTAKRRAKTSKPSAKKTGAAKKARATRAK